MAQKSLIKAVGDAAMSALVLVVVEPVICLVCMAGDGQQCGNDEMQERRETGQQKEKIAWHPCLQKRPHKGTGGRSSLTNKVADQQQCFILSRLPQEIRDQIYSYVMDGKHLQLGVVNPDCKCVHTPGTPCDDPAHNKSKTWPRLRLRGGKEMFSYILTCKLAYLDGSSYIYDSTVFKIASITELFFLERLLPRPDFQRIRHLHLRWYLIDQKSPGIIYLKAWPPCDLDTWLQTCTILESGEGLKTLRIDMRLEYDGDLDRWAEKAMFDPVCALSRRVQVEVFVSWKISEWDDESRQDWPFKLNRDAENSMSREWWD